MRRKSKPLIEPLKTGTILVVGNSNDKRPWVLYRLKRRNEFDERLYRIQSTPGRNLSGLYMPGVKLENEHTVDQLKAFGFKRKIVSQKEKERIENLATKRETDKKERRKRRRDARRTKRRKRRRTKSTMDNS